MGRLLSLRVTIIAHDGIVLGDSDVEASQLATLENHRLRPEVQTAAREGTGSAIRWSETVKVEFIYVARRLDPYILRLAMPLSSVDGEEAADELFEHRQRVRVELIGGTSIEGELLYSASQEGPRVVDLLNRRERFLRLWTENRIVLVNKKMLSRVVEKSAPREQPCRKSTSS